jgi:hypothetical protein
MRRASGYLSGKEIHMQATGLQANHEKVEATRAYFASQSCKLRFVAIIVIL